MLLKLITPFGTTEINDIKSVLLPGASGEFMLMPNHESLMSLVKDGEVKVTTNTSGEKNFNISSGVVECFDNIVSLLAEKIEERKTAAK